MNNTENSGTSSWERVQSGVKDTERLISQKQYHAAMVKARQTLEYMVNCLCEREGITEGNLIDMIDALYEAGVLDRMTCEHYHKIRTIGNKAIHEEDNSAYNAQQAHHLLSQQVYALSGQDQARRRPSHPKRKAKTQLPKMSSGKIENRIQDLLSSPVFSAGGMIKILLVAAIIGMVILIVHLLRPSDPPADLFSTSVSTEAESPETAAPEESSEAIEETTAPAETETETVPEAETSTEAETEPVTEAETIPLSTEETEPPTEAPTETVPPQTETPKNVRYIAATTINVRFEPSTNNDRIGVISPGSEVEYVRDYDDKWCVIKYYGKDAYVSRAFITPIAE